MSDFRSTIDRVKLLIKTAVDGGALDESAVIGQIGKDITPEMSPAIVDYALRNMAWACIRNHQAAIEARHAKERAIRDAAERAERMKAIDEQLKAMERRTQKPAPVLSEEEEFEELFRNPGRAYGPEPRDILTPISNQKNRKKFKRWCQKNGKQFDEWHARAKAACDPEMEDRFGGDWHPGGVSAYHEEERRAFFIQAAKHLVDIAVEQTELKITAELLGSEFALGDGRRVTWGNATVEDHSQRIELLKQNIAGNAETAALHQCAVNMITAANVERLADLEPVTV